MKLFFEKIQRNKQSVATFFLALLVVGLISRPAMAAANGSTLMDAAVNLLSAIINWITGGIGWILVFFFKVLLGVAQFTTFVDAGVVKTGWPIVRDICNMFFILALLIIAFSTILGINNNWKKELPKLLMAAVLINFSKTIAGLMIDASQIFMLTFINAVAAAGAGNFAIIFDVSKYSSMTQADPNLLTDMVTQSDKTATTKLSLLAGTIAAFAAVLITTVITVVMIAAFVMRIVKLWAYLILSPLPYLLSSFSGGKSYANQWWSEFTKELIGGPVLAFFLWLALTIGANSSDYTTYTSKALDQQNTITSLFSDGPFQRYIMVVAFLVLGLQMAAKAGGTMGEWAGKGSKWVNSGAAFAKKNTLGRAQNLAVDTAKNTGSLMGRTGLRAGGAVLSGISSKGGTFDKIGKFTNQWGNDLRETRLDAKRDARLKTLKGFGFKQKSFEQLETVMNDDKIKIATKGVKAAGLAAAGIATGGIVPGALGVAGAVGMMSNGTLGRLMQQWGGHINTPSVKRVSQLQDEKNKTISDARKTKEDTIKGAEDTWSKTINDHDAKVKAGLITKEDHDKAITAANIKRREDIATANTDFGRAERVADIQYEDKMRGGPTSAIERDKKHADARAEYAKFEKEYDDKINLVLAKPLTATYTDTMRVQEAIALEDERDAKRSEQKNLWREKRRGANEEHDIFKDEAKFGHRVLAKVNFGDLVTGAGAFMNNYNPNALTSRAVGKETEESTKARDNVSAIGKGASLVDSNNKIFNDKLFSELNNTTKNSVDAMNEMVSQMEAINAKPSIDGGDKSTMVAMKQWLARMNKEGKKMDLFKPLIDALNNRASEHGGTVDSYGDKLTKA